MRAAPVGTKNKKRIALGFLIVAVLLLLLTFRVAYWQIIKGEWLTEKAIAQQTQDTPIEAKRGAIYDRNGKELATSITCYTLWARPAPGQDAEGQDHHRGADRSDRFADCTDHRTGCGNGTDELNQIDGVGADREATWIKRRQMRCVR